MTIKSIVMTLYTHSLSSLFEHICTPYFTDSVEYVSMCACTDLNSLFVVIVTKAPDAEYHYYYYYCFS